MHLRFGVALLALIACTGDGDDTGVSAGDGDITVSPSSIDFGQLFLGDSEQVDIRVKNVGNGDVAVLVTIAGAAAGDYVIAPFTSAPAKGEEAVHALTFTPTDWGNRSVSLIVEDSISGGSVEIPITTTVQVDSDGDGFGDINTGGEDCDDQESAVNPDAEEVCGDGIDNDCEGGDLPCDGPEWEDGPLADVSTTTSGDAGEGFGSALEIGDVTGDGVDDLIVGAPTDSTVADAAGLAFVYPGPLSNLDSASAFTISTDSVGGALGASVSIIGDYNGDGEPDLAVGVPLDNTIRTNQGRALIILGPIDGDIDALDADARLYGDQRKDYAGRVVAPAGDIDEDGYDDVLIGAPELSDGRMGRVFLLPGDSVSGYEDLGNMRDTVYGGDGFARVGDLVLSADFDGDGVPDSVVGGSDIEAAAGEVTLFIVDDGPSGDVLITDADSQFQGHLQMILEDGSVDAGDIDGDGHDDLLVGASSLLSPSTNQGMMCVINGPFGATADLTDASGCLEGTEAAQNLGSRVAVLGDFADNGGVDLVGVDGDGVLHMVYGDLSGMETAADQLLTPPSDSKRVGQAIVGGGDVDDDGVDDMAVGAPGFTTDVGSVFLVFGPL
jgi:hypothetical protein